MHTVTGARACGAGAQDEERLKKAINTVPTHAELNAMVARGEPEREAFDRMDAELSWPSLEGAPCGHTAAPPAHTPACFSAVRV